jgi:hypothetical protein
MRREGNEPAEGRRLANVVVSSNSWAACNSRRHPAVGLVAKIREGMAAVWDFSCLSDFLLGYAVFRFWV